MLVFGVDPGLKGAVVCMDSKSKDVVLHWLMEDWHEAVNYARESGGKPHFILEAAQAMPGQGVTSVFSYGQGYGRLIGWLESLEIPYQTVHPRAWTKEMLAGVPADLEKKERNREAFRRLYPGLYKTVLNKNKNPHDGIVDACLIARWGCNHIL